MAKIVKGARFVSKYANSTNIKPTIPVDSTETSFQNDDHTTGWNSTDIYVGEWYFNIYDSKAYFRTPNGIYEVIAVQNKDNNGVTVTDSKSKISASYLPGNYLGAMVFKGSWDAATNFPALGTTEKAEKGDYYIVSVAGETPLRSGDGSISEWNVGDFAVYTNSLIGWEKIDNTERDEYANIVQYENLFDSRPQEYFPTKDTVQLVLDNIYEQLYLSPTFNNPTTFNKPITLNDTENNNSTPTIRINGNPTTTNRFLYLNGNTTDKWITFNGSDGSNGNGTLKIGTEGYSNTLIDFGPYGIDAAIALSSTINFNYSSAFNRTKRWSIYSSPSDSHIKGYASNGIDENIKLSLNTTDNSFIKSKLIIGNVSNSAISDLQVNSTTNSILAITRSNTALANNLEIGKLSFHLASNSTTFNEYINLVGKIADDTTNNSTLVVRLRGNGSSTPVDALTLKGTNTGFYLGINKGSDVPMAPLDVNGGAIISGNLTLGTTTSTHNISGTVLINNNMSINGVLNSIKSTSSDIFTIKSNTTTYSTLYWLNSSKSIQINGNLGNTHITYDTLNGNLTLNTSKLYLLNTDLEFTTASKNVNFNNALVTNAIFGSVSFNQIASYDNPYTHTDFSSNDIINKQSLVDYVAIHSVGLWSTGQNLNQYVAYDLNQIKQVGINIDNPQYNLHVIGNSKITDTLYTTNIILDTDQQERFIRTNVYGGAIRFRGNGPSTVDRNLKFGRVDNSNNFIDIMTLDSDNYNVSIGTNADTSTYKLFVDGTFRTSGILYASTLNIGTTDSIASSNGLYVEGKTRLKDSVGIATSPINGYLLSVSGNTFIDGNVDISDTLRVNGTSKFDSKVIINGSSPNIITNTDLYAGGNAYVNRLNIGDGTNFTSYKLNVSGNAYIEDKVGINGYNTNYRLFVNGTMYSTSIDVNGSVKSSTYTSYTLPSDYYLKLDDTNTSLRVPGTIKTDNGLVVGSISQTPLTDGLYVHGKTQMNDVVGIGLIPNYNYSLGVSGDTIMLGDLNVSGITIIENKLISNSISTNNIGLGITPDTNYKIKANGKSYLMDNVGIGIIPDNNFKLKVDGATYTKTLSRNTYFEFIPQQKFRELMITYEPLLPTDQSNLEYDRYIYDLTFFGSDIKIDFKYLDINTIKNRNFEIIFSQYDSQMASTIIHFNIFKSEIVGDDYGVALFQDENGSTSLIIPEKDYGDVPDKTIKINLSFYDCVFFRESNYRYKQNVIWDLEIYTIYGEVSKKMGLDVKIFDSLIYNWTRSGTTVVVTVSTSDGNGVYEGHGLSTGDIIYITHSSNLLTIPKKNYNITYISTNTFSIQGINVGDVTGYLAYK